MLLINFQSAKVFFFFDSFVHPHSCLLGRLVDLTSSQKNFIDFCFLST